MGLGKISAWLGAVALAFSSGVALAQGAGKPVPGGTDFQNPVTPVMEDLIWMDDLLLVVISIITLFVVVLLGIVIIRFNKKANPTPSKFTHNALIEVIWTAVPVLILIIIAIPSLRLLFLQLDVPEADITIKATGNQWYWSYEYPDEDISMDAFMLAKDELAANGYKPDEYLLATDSRLIVPVNANVHVLVTGSDVIHSWAVPSFGIKIDAIPGRINETWFRATEPGLHFGQCSELCGKDHSFMPIVVEVVSQDRYDAWIKTEQAKLTSATSLAQAD